MKKPIIKYPCVWSYRIIGQDDQLLQNAVSNAVGDKEYQISFANKSSGGKYRSLNVEVRVHSEQERVDTFERLRNDPNVKVVI
jgi:putative lipoic acid-binding regulatory protein